MALYSHVLYNLNLPHICLEFGPMYAGLRLSMDGISVQNRICDLIVHKPHVFIVLRNELRDIVHHFLNKIYGKIVNIFHVSLAQKSMRKSLDIDISEALILIHTPPPFFHFTEKSAKPSLLLSDVSKTYTLISLLRIRIYV